MSDQDVVQDVVQQQEGADAAAEQQQQQVEKEEEDADEAAGEEEESRKRAREEEQRPATSVLQKFATQLQHEQQPSDPSIGNGAGEEEESASKRARILSGFQYPVSCVFHIRNLPVNVTDEQLVSLIEPFGKLVSIVTLQYNQAFLEVDSMETAEKMLLEFADTPAQIGGQTVYLQPSKHPTVENGRVPGGSMQPDHPVSACILMVVFSNIQHPVTVDVLEQVFGPSGALSKVVIFTKGGRTSALIQFVDREGARKAQEKLHGQNIYAGCNGMSITYSTSTNEVTVRAQTPLSRDFLLPVTAPTPKVVAGGPGQLATPTTAPVFPPMGAGAPAPFPPSGAGFPPQNNFIQQKLQQQLQPQGQPYGMPPMQQHRQQQQPRGGQSGSVIIVSQMNAEKITTDYLFRLFGVYGDVLRVKIMFKKRDTCLIQFTDHSGAARAVQYLNQFQMWGQPIRVNFSKAEYVTMPSESSPTSAEFGFNHPMHRFRRPDSKNLKYISEPNPMLHISSLPLDSDDETVRSYIAPFGNMVAWKWLADGKLRQGLATMENVQQATDALVGLHNREIAPRTFLRLNFSVAGSKNRPQQGGGGYDPQGGSGYNSQARYNPQAGSANTGYQAGPSYGGAPAYGSVPRYSQPQRQQQQRPSQQQQYAGYAGGGYGGAYQQQRPPQQQQHQQQHQQHQQHQQQAPQSSVPPWQQTQQQAAPARQQQTQQQQQPYVHPSRMQHVPQIAPASADYTAAQQQAYSKYYAHHAKK